MQSDILQMCIYLRNCEDIWIFTDIPLTIHFLASICLVCFFPQLELHIHAFQFTYVLVQFKHNLKNTYYPF